MSVNSRNTPPEALLTQFNALDFMIRSTIRGMVHTAIPVVVKSIERPKTGGGASYLSAMPLVQPNGADGEALPSATIPKLRWFRLQAGSAAIVCDPKVGDVGLAVFAHADVSTLNGENTPKQTGSWRTFDMSDGFYFGGFWGQKPTTFVHIEDTGDIVITGPKTVTVNTTKATVNTSTCIVNASKSKTVNSPISTFNGNVVINGSLNCAGGSGGSGATITGGCAVTGDVTADGISLKNHTHTGDSGGTTSPPL